MFLPASVRSIRYERQKRVITRLFILAAAIFTTQLVLMYLWGHRPRYLQESGRIRRIAVWDNKTGHDEVILPTLWNLQQLAGVEVDLFRNTFRPGARQELDEWFNGRHFKFEEFTKQDFTVYSVVLLTTGDQSSASLLESKILEAYPHLKVVSVAHWVLRYASSTIPRAIEKRTRQWPLTIGDLDSINDMIREKRWSFLSLSPHVTNNLTQTLAVDKHGNALHPTVETFIPVMPVRRSNKERGGMRPFIACIVGRVTSSRNYGRIFSLLSKARYGRPKLWSRSQDEHSNGPDIGATSPSAFELLLLGETAAGGSLNIPKSLKGIVRKTGSASQSKFFQYLSTADVVIPAFRDQSRYTTTVASGAIPAAVMARVPVLVDKAELEAYSYLEPPAYMLRLEGEDEIQAIERIRTSTEASSMLPIDDAIDWANFEERLYASNARVLGRILGHTTAETD